ncbi:hypothetical protein PFISCL1PPCAC_2304, partial [Pristionchus fissidentatus]
IFFVPMTCLEAELVSLHSLTHNELSLIGYRQWKDSSPLTICLQQINMGKNKAKNAGKRRMEEDETPVKIPKGCPCPGMKGCTIGRPVSPEEDSVTLICSAVSCPFEGIPCHKECFEKYEDQLLKALGDRGSARGWTPYKARRNLWKNNGQGLIAMCCRCLCSKGNVRPPEDFVSAERIIVSLADADKRKKHKKKDLPVINMDGGANVKQARMQARMEKEEKDRERMDGRDPFSTPPFTPRRTRSNSVNSFSSQSIVSTTSTYRTATTEDRALTHDEDSPLSLGSRRRESRMKRVDEKSKRRDESRARLDSGVSIGTPPTTPVCEVTIELIPAGNPPPLVRSYAATIKSDPEVHSHLPAISSQEGEVQEVLLLSQSIDIPPSASSSVHSLLTNYPQPPKWWLESSPAWEIVSYGLYPPEVLQSHGSAAAAAVGQSMQPFDIHDCPIWNPWEGRDFDLGDFDLSICGVSLPTNPIKKEKKG